VKRACASRSGNALLRLILYPNKGILSSAPKFSFYIATTGNRLGATPLANQCYESERGRRGVEGSENLQLLHP